MTLITELTSAGVLQSDEPVVCDLSLNGYYVGFLAYLPAGNLFDAGNPNAGVYTDVGHGTQLTVLRDGMPPDANHVLVDFQTGLVWSTTQRSLVVDYYGITSVNYYPQHPLTISVPECLLDGDTDLEVRRVTLPHFQKYGYAAINVWGATTANGLTFTFKNADSGGDERTLVLASGVSNPAIYTMTTPFKVTAAEVFILEVDDGKDLTGVDFRFYGW